MSTLSIVVQQPGIQIGLQALQVGIDSFPESDLVEILQYRLMESLTDTVLDTLTQLSHNGRTGANLFGFSP